ncbi:DNA mismatch endonuclease Vsr [Mucilaginibacter sp. CAU 1740]|uniref:very short patch repair endonuclease n=1 Tax=Mucilaginibacter sp. CAU 1740 TaxID=3140365 RepID=UPI00325C23F4
MADVHTKETRSYNMSRIRNRDTMPEILVRKFLFSRGFRFRLHGKKLPGKPDIILPKYKTVIFIHGCFWHGHNGCRYFVVPKTRTEWWLNKISGNQTRDRQAEILLAAAGWHIITLWECDLRKKAADHTLDQLECQLRERLM